MAKIKQGPPADKVELFDKLIATIPEIERKGDTNPTSYNGNMFTHLTPEGIFSIRLPEKELESFMKKYKTKLLEIYGIVKKDFVVVPESLFKKSRTQALSADEFRLREDAQSEAYSQVQKS